MKNVKIWMEKITCSLNPNQIINQKWHYQNSTKIHSIRAQYMEWDCKSCVLFLLHLPGCENRKMIMYIRLHFLFNIEDMKNSWYNHKLFMHWSITRNFAVFPPNRKHQWTINKLHRGLLVILKTFWNFQFSRKWKNS